MRPLACLALLLRANRDDKAILADKNFTHKTRIQALKILIGATIIVLAEGSSMAATITVRAPDGEGRVFVDVVGKIDDGDFEAFKQKTDPIGASHPKKLVIVTLISYGGAIGPAMQIGELIRKRGMLTFVPGDRTCASACALIWVAGWLRTVGDIPQIGFHAAHDEDSGRESGAGNAVMGAYLRDLEFGYKAIHFMTHKGPTELAWLTPDQAKEVGIAWLMLQPSRAIPIPPQQRGIRPPLQVIAAWSKLMPRPMTASPERGNETVVVKRASPPIHVPQPPEEVRGPALWPVYLRFPADWHSQEPAHPAYLSPSRKVELEQFHRAFSDAPDEIVRSWHRGPAPPTSIVKHQERFEPGGHQDPSCSCTPNAVTRPVVVKRPAENSKPPVRGSWMIQVGAYPAEQAAQERLSSARIKASKMLTGAEAFIEAVEKGGMTFYVARFAGLDKDEAEAACKYLKKNDVECVMIKERIEPGSQQASDPPRMPTFLARLFGGGIDE